MIKLIKFHVNKKRIFINPDNVCAVYQGDSTTINTVDGASYKIDEPLFDVVEKLTFTGKGKAKVLNPCRNKS